MKNTSHTQQANAHTRFDQEKMFAGILQMAREAGREAAKGLLDSGSIGLGVIVVPDRRRAFTRWLIANGHATDGTKCAYVDHEGGQWYWSARAYADEFCAVLKKCGIECYNTVELD